MTISYQKHILNTPTKRIIASSFFLYYPVVFAVIGTPITPSMITPLTPELMNLFSIMSTCVTLIGGLMGVGFYVERRNNNKLKEQADIHAKEVKELHKKIDEKTEMLNTTIHEMETRLCNTMVEKDGINEKDAASKILNAKNIVDEKFRNIDGRLQNIEKYFWSNKFGQPGTYTDSTKKKMGNSNNRNYDHYDDNDDDNGGSCLSG